MLSTDATKKGSIQSVERALSLLELLSSTNESLSASEIAEELNMKRTTVYGLLTTLIQKDYVVAENSEYQISGKLYNLSYKFPIRFPVTQIAYKYMLELSQAYDLTAHLGILDIKDRVLMVKAAFPRTDAAHTGISFPLHATSIGKVLLAYQLPKKREELLRGMVLLPYTNNTIRDIDTLTRELDTIFNRGYGYDDGEYMENTFCVAVPIFNERNQIVAAMSVSGEPHSIHPMLTEVLPKLLQCGKNCSMEMGWDNKPSIASL